MNKSFSCVQIVIFLSYYMQCGAFEWRKKNVPIQNMHITHIYQPNTQFEVTQHEYAVMHMLSITSYSAFQYT